MRPSKKKLLVATVGLAAVSYIGCAEKPTGNLMVRQEPPYPSASPTSAPGPGEDGGSAGAKEPSLPGDAGAAASAPDSGKALLPPDDHRFRTGNLMAPPPPPPSASAKKK